MTARQCPSTSWSRGWIGTPGKNWHYAAIPLWPETIVALRDWLDQRTEPREESLLGCFLTQTGGTFASDDRPICRKTRAFGQAQIRGHRSFYGLQDLRASAGIPRPSRRRRLDGPVDNTMAAHYRERISEGPNAKRSLIFIRAWLHPEPESKEEGLNENCKRR